MLKQIDCPLVSVVMTVRNVEAYIAEAIASILEERTVALEVIVIDNGCTDRTIEQIQAFGDDRIRLLEGPRLGIAHALNVAYANVRGEFIIRCDGDDSIPTGRIARQTNWLQSHPEFGAVCGGFTMIDTKSRALADLQRDSKPQEITDELRNGMTRTHIGTFAIRTESVEAAGWSREYFDCLEDIDFQLRLGEICRVWFESEIEYLYRLHPSSVTHTVSDVKRQFYDAIAVEFQRQRRTRGYDDLQLGCPPPIPEGSDSKMDAAAHTSKMLLGSAWIAHREGRKWQAVTKGIKAAVLQPQQVSNWRSLVALMVKPGGRRVQPDICQPSLR